MSELDYSEVKNPLALALETQVQLELEWAFVEKDLYSFGWSLIAQTPKKEDVKRLKSLVDQAVLKFKEIGAEKLTKSEFILGLCLAFKVLVENGNGLKDELVQTIQQFLDIAKNRRWFDSEEFASIVLYCLGSAQEFREDCKAISKWLEEREKIFVDQGNHEKLVDCIFGLTGWKDSSLSKSLPENIPKNLSSFGVETLAKICILEREATGPTVVRQLEKNLETEFSNKPNYFLERALRDLASMLHSDYPEQAVSSFLEARRKEGQSWAHSVDYVNGQLVLKRTPELGSLPRIDPKAHSLALVALSVAGQTTLYTLSRKSLERALQASRQVTPGFVGVRKKEYTSILVIASVTALVLALSSIDLIIRFANLRPDDLGSFVLEVSRDWTRVLTLGPEALLIFVWVWFFRILYHLRDGGQLGRMEFVRLIPFVGYIFSRLVSE